MKYFRLVWSGLWRKRMRTILTIASIIVAFLLFGMLQGVDSAFSSSVAATHLDRLYVQSRVSFTESLPYGQLAKIEEVPGIDRVSYATWFGGYFQDPKNFIFSFPVDAETYFSVYSDIEVPSDQVKSLINTRNGAIVGTELAKKYGWKIGDHIPLKSTIWTHPGGSYDWDFEIVGIYAYPTDPSQANSFLFNHVYLDEGRTFGKGRVGWYIVHLSDPSKGPEIAKAIDALFANSPDETRTQNEKENTQSFLKQFGDINFMISAVIGAVFFTLLFLTGNTMMQSIRERIPDFAVLKALGFTNRAILLLILGEASLMCVLAALVGLGLAAMTFPGLSAVIGVATMPVQVVGFGIGAAILLAIITGLPPALKITRISIIDGLAGR